MPPSFWLNGFTVDFGDTTVSSGTAATVEGSTCQGGGARLRRAPNPGLWGVETGIKSTKDPREIQGKTPSLLRESMIFSLKNMILLQFMK